MWGQVGERIVWSAAVPVGKLWVIDNIGLATTDNRALPYAIQRFHPNGHYVPVVGMTPSLGTPTLGWTGRLVLVAGSMVGGRVNAPQDFAQMAVLYTGWEFPASCLALVLGVEASSVSVLNPPPVNYAPFVAALAAAATALNAVGEAVP